MRDEATVNYHIKSAAPQAFRFDVDGVVGNLVSPELAPTSVRVENVRDSAHAPSFDKDSIMFEHHVSEVADFESSSGWQTVYDAELTSLLRSELGAVEVIVFDHTIRVDDPAAARKPARNVHTDYSKAGAQQRLIDLVGEQRAETFRQGRYGFVNVWRPVEHTIKTSPLGFIRPSSVIPEDWMTIDLIYPDRQGQILGVAANANHDWFYLPDMTPDEVAIFSIYDNGGRPFLGHSALDMAEVDDVLMPRKSIESRTLVRYA
ncbi:MAG: CmcJ/NvfI family oxidoreductase [Pseudomonadota bacterium]